MQMRSLLALPKERQMKTTQLILACTIALGLSGAAYAGPCTTGKSAEMRDAGSGPTPGNTGTIGSANTSTGQHPPTSAMNLQAGNTPASSEDAQKQMQGQPTAAQQAEGATAAPGKTADNDC
jgi:hypothetical protein